MTDPLGPHRRHLLQLAAAGALGLPSVLRAQPSWPARPVRIVVPFPAGGGADVAARALAQQLQAAIRQTVVVDNRAGADGLLAVQETLRSPADGHTLFMATASSLSFLPNIRRKTGFDPLKDFTPLSTFLTFVFYLMVHESIPGRTLAEVITHLKANPGKYSYGNANSTSNLAAAQLAAGSGLQLVGVPYKGEAQMTPDLIGGRIHLAWATSAVLPALMKEGKSRPLAVLMPRRTSALPEVPTIAEAGQPLVDIHPWGGFVVHAATPPELSDVVGKELRSLIDRPELVAAIDKVGLVARGSSAAEFGELLKTQLAAFNKAIKLAGLPVEE